jgi:hypothetical protein
MFSSTTATRLFVASWAALASLWAEPTRAVHPNVMVTKILIKIAATFHPGVMAAPP